MTDLLTLSRDHDLPPKWDGHPVEWEGWRDSIDVFICPPPRDREPCEACGCIGKPVMNSGTVTVHWPDSVTAIGRTRLRERVSRSRLTVFRCTQCRHDTVLDHNTDQWWDLDYTDYGPDGSDG